MTLSRTRRILTGVVAAATLLTLAGCGTKAPSTPSGGDTTSAAAPAAAVTLQYWLWDDSQKPGYQKCADDFHAANPNITVEISQYAWGQYWTNLSTQIAAGTAPDVWTDQPSYYPQFVQDKQIVDLKPYLDANPYGVDMTKFVAGTEMYKIGDAIYGLPKDWDTMGLVINKKAAADAGVTADDLAKMTWNPTDGGTFEKIMAKLTVDTKGVRGDQPGFDKTSIATYGFLPEWGDGSQGQNGWGELATMNGFTYADTNPFGTKFNYDSPALIETITWLAGLSAKGYAPALDVNSSLDRRNQVQAGTGAMTTLGSFNQMMFKDTPNDFIFAPLPIGPKGRMSVANSLSDAMYSGSKNKDQAWQWIAYLASPACQNVIGDTGIVFPAIGEATQKSLAARKALGLDASVFTDSYTPPNGSTFIIPISYHGNEIAQIVQDAIQSVALGQADAKTALTAANDKVNALFK